MKKLILLLFIAYMILSPFAEAKNTQNRTKKRIHPSFAALLEQYPRKYKIVNPEVPRISAQVAFELYKSQKAFFFALGTLAHGHEIVGAINIKNYKDPMIIRKLKNLQNKNKNKYFILFCA